MKKLECCNSLSIKYELPLDKIELAYNKVMSDLKIKGNKGKLKEKCEIILEQVCLEIDSKSKTPKLTDSEQLAEAVVQILKMLKLKWKRN